VLPSDPHPTAFVSYAFSSSSRSRRDIERWRKTVLDFAILLCGLGIDADVDQFYEHVAGIDWSRWGAAAAREKDFILLAVSPEYRERWEGDNRPDEGPGSVREIDELMGQFEADQQRFRTRVHVVLLPGADERDIPHQLRGLHRFILPELTNTAAEPLYRTLTGQPATPKPKIGPLRRLPARPLDEQQEEAISEAEGSVGDLARQVAELRIDLARVRGALASIPSDVRDRAPSGGVQPPQVRVARRLEEESEAIHSRLKQLQDEAESTVEPDGFVARLGEAISHPKHVAIAAVVLGGAVVSLVGGSGLLFLVIVGLGLLAGVFIGVGYGPDVVDRVLGAAAALAVFELAREAFSVALAGAAVLALACGALVVARGARAIGAGVLAALALGVSAYAAAGDEPPRETSRGAVLAATASSKTPTPTPTPTPTESATPEASPADAACGGTPFSGTEREATPEQPSNDDPETSDGPLAGGKAVRGETLTLNDEDWLRFCPTADKVGLRLMSLTPGYDCEQMHAELWEADATEDDEPVVDLAPGNAWVTRTSADVEPGELYRVKISAEGKRCEWLLNVGPPGSLAGDATTPTTVPCVPEAERSPATREQGLEPNESIDDVVPIAAGPFEEHRSNGALRLQTAGQLANANDVDWFALCSGAEQRAVTLELLNVDLDPADYASPCQDLSLSLRNADGGEVANNDTDGELTRRTEIAWTMEPDSRYYAEISHDDGGRCHWRLTVGPASAFSATLPVDAWDGGLR
jgi:hypothetical protein